MRLIALVVQVVTGATAARPPATSRDTDGINSGSGQCLKKKTRKPDASSVTQRIESRREPIRSILDAICSTNAVAWGAIATKDSIAKQTLWARRDRVLASSRIKLPPTKSRSG